MTIPRIGVLALQGGVDEHVAHLRKAGADPVKIRRPGELEGLDGLIIPGGESTTISKLLVAMDLDEPVRNLLSGGLPVWGICAGMILLSKTIIGGREDQISFGAIDATVKRNAFGSQVQSHEEELRFEGFDYPVHAVFIRAPIVESVGPDVSVLARSSRGSNPIVAISQGSALATSFHPELSSSSRMHQFFLESFVVKNP